MGIATQNGHKPKNGHHNPNHLHHQQQQQQQQQDNEKFIVKYRHNYYDFTRFLKNHPGGITTLRDLNNGDMTARFMKAPPHSDAAMYLMNEYKIRPSEIKKTKQGNSQGSSNGDDEFKTSENGIELIEEQEDKNNNQLDESMEHLVDWSKAMLPQIPNITKHYDEWVHKPVDRPLRLFGPWYLEIFTKTPWWVVPTFWVPVILQIMGNEYETDWQAEGSTKFAFFSLFFLIGVLFWTLLEYVLHRFVFHMKVSGNVSPWICTFHFMIHGLHHKVPFDDKRLVFPPLPGVLIAFIIYAPLSYLVCHPRAILSGALFGYLCYDMMHYYLHYGNPTAPHLYHMKRYHYQHHFAHQDLGYGISSPLWDFVFKTQVHLRKLRFQLRWK